MTASYAEMSHFPPRTAPSNRPSASLVDRTASGFVLIADEDSQSRERMDRDLSQAGFPTIVVSNGKQAIDAMGHGVRVAILNMDMTRVNGMDCLRYIAKNFPDTRTVMVGDSNDVADAVAAIKAGAGEYLTKPIHSSGLLEHVQQAWSRFELTSNHRAQGKFASPPGTVCDSLAQSAAARAMASRVERIAKLDSTVLITGESGVGKTTVAKAIHQNGPRSQMPFVAVNCASLPRDLIETELFGHAKGAFTGAVGERPGHVEIANGGTLFLDEIGDLPIELQPKLLTFLQDQTIRRIGSTDEVKVDVRLIAATHCDLSSMCAKKTFRQDLFYRLNVLAIDVPPLRDRRRDIPLLAASILDRIAAHRGCVTPEIHDAAMARLVQYDWPGNIREMENVLERITAFSDDAVITADDVLLANAVADAATNGAAGATGSDMATDMATDMAGRTLAEIEKMAIEATLVACHGNKAKTARHLGISEKSIYNKMRRHGLR